jgi:cation transport ATPase
MRLGGQRLDLALYFQALPVYARNLGVLLPPLIAAGIGVGLRYASGPLFAGVGGAGYPIIAFIIQILYGYAFAVSVIFADDAWRHGRGNLRSAWDQASRKAGNILISVIGFYFLIYVAGLVGGIGGPILSEALSALAVWAFIYSIPAAAIGGVPSGAAFSASLQAARRHPLATAILVIVSLIVWYGLAIYAPASIGPYVSAGYDVAVVLLTAIALGYIALIVARQYADFAFRFW